LYIQYPI